MYVVTRPILDGWSIVGFEDIAYESEDQLRNYISNSLCAELKNDIIDAYGADKEKDIVCDPGVVVKKY